MIVIAGNIAAGKSTLARALGRGLNLTTHLECDDSNPYLDTPQTKALETEFWFLHKSLTAYADVSLNGGVIERHPREHISVFAHVKHKRGWLSDSERDRLVETLNVAEPLPSPD